jgi:transcriptional regulator with XRE-family HTH domain
MKTSLKIIVGRRIREARNKLKLTQQELAEKADVDYKYLQRMEGKTPPNLKLETIERIATALKISPAKLLDF